MVFHGGVIFGLTVVFVCAIFSGAAAKNNPQSRAHWHPASATWYGSPNGDGSSGGACGYGTLVDVKPFKARVGAVNPVLFKNGEGCGACYKVKCLDNHLCSRKAVTVIITDECPGCAPGGTHFDMSGAAFGRMAVAGNGGQLRNRGLISVIYKKTRCKYLGRNVAFRVNEGSTEFWLSLLVEYEDGDGDIGAMHIRPSIFYGRDKCKVIYHQYTEIDRTRTCGGSATMVEPCKIFEWGRGLHLGGDEITLTGGGFVDGDTRFSW